MHACWYMYGHTRTHVHVRSGVQAYIKSPPIRCMSLHVYVHVSAHACTYACAYICTPACMRPQTQLPYRETHTQTYIRRQPTSESAKETDIKEDEKRCKPWNPTGTDTLQCLWKLRRRRTFSTGAELSVYHHRAAPTLRHARQRLTTSSVPPASWRACLATSARCAALPPKR